MKLISLNVEASGPDVDACCVPLAIGAVVVNTNHIMNDHETNMSDANFFYIQLEWDSIKINPIVLYENQLNVIEPPGDDGPEDDRSLPASEAVQEFSDWVNAQGDMPIRAMGKNIGSFCLPLLKSVWEGSWPFHEKSIHLGTLFFAISLIDDKKQSEIRRKIMDRSWQTVKQYRPNSVKHNALDIAWANAYALCRCMGRLRH